ncbi:MAG: DUF2971 domain-containing protein [Balneolaceae bacterium]
MAYTSRPIYLQVPAIHTPELEEAAKPFLSDWLKKHTLENGEQLFHYTDLNGLKGILKERGLWISHISTLNDPFELKYGQKLIIQELDNQIVKENEDNIREFYNSIKISVGSFGKAMHQTFIACFCESENLLSQWRAYSNNGGGFSIGFEINDSSLITFEKTNFEECFKPILRKIIYKPEEQMRLIKDYINIVTEGYRKGIVGKVSGVMNENYHSAVMGSQASNLLLDLILSIKNPAFSEEKEWRLIHVILDHHEPEKLKFRESNYDLIPYKQSYLFDRKDESNIFPIKSIILGPSIDQESQKSAIQLFLNHSSASENEIIIDKPGLVNVKSAGYELK